MPCAGSRKSRRKHKEPQEAERAAGSTKSKEPRRAREREKGGVPHAGRAWERDRAQEGKGGIASTFGRGERRRHKAVRLHAPPFCSMRPRGREPDSTKKYKIRINI